MRTFCALIVWTFSLAAMACPNLAGSYTSCRSTTRQSAGTRDVVVTQRVINGATEYSITATDEETQERGTQVYIADGQTRSEEANDPNTGLTWGVSTQAQCSNARTLSVLTAISINGQPAGQVRTTATKIGNQVQLVTEGNIFGQPLNDSEICE